MEEAELIGAAQGGDRAAFDELVRRTFVDTFTLARRLTGNEEDARDVVQDAYLRAWRGIGKFRGEAQFSTWMYRITANAAAKVAGVTFPGAIGSQRHVPDGSLGPDGRTDWTSPS